MSTPPLDFLKNADEMAQSSLESNLRNAISRAYYAVYHTAIVIAEAKPLPDTSAYQTGSHAKVALRFDREGSRQGKAIADMLRTLHRERVRADYKLSQDVTQADAMLHIQMVKRLLMMLQHYSASIN